AATACLFAKEGAKLVLVARRHEELDKVVQDITANGGIAIAHASDVRMEEHAEAAVLVAVREFGGLDIAFNNAGTLGEMGSIPDVSLAGWQATLDVNLTGPFLGAKYQVPAMLERGGGSIIFTSTFVGHTVGFPSMAAYAASKAGLVGLTKVLAAEYGPRKIRANAILCGGVDTEMGRIVADTEEARAHVESLHALKRIAEPKEIAATALYLASHASSFVTGTALLADGGISINRS
ncbi:MAG: SDR family oxidoreductase, partial [Pseudomonadota bacterium]